MGHESAGHIEDGGQAEHHGKGDGQGGVATEKWYAGENVGQGIGGLYQVVGKAHGEAGPAQDGGKGEFEHLARQGDDCAAQHQAQGEPGEYPVHRLAGGGHVDDNVGRSARQGDDGGNRAQPEAQLCVLRQALHLICPPSWT